MEYLLSKNLLSLFLILLFSIRLSAQNSARDREIRYFWLTLISCLLLVATDTLEVMCSEDPGLRFWRTLLSILAYTFRSTAAAGLVMIAARPERRKKSIWIPCAVNLLVCCTAFFTDIAFGFDENYDFYRGPLGYVSFAVPIFYLAAILWLTYKRYGDGKRTDRVILVICALMCLVAASVDVAIGGARLNEAIIISCIFFYLFLRSYDVRRDSLTLLLNRQTLYDDCAEMGKSICAAASLDMNGLKQMNDRHGHASGDAALRIIGECLLAEAGQRVRPYRIGGDEFVVLFFQTDEVQVIEILERICRNIAENGISAAYGYAIREEGEEPESVIRRSDLKMFEQKAQYYREKQHDRRRSRQEQTAAFSRDMKKAIEGNPMPAAAYRFTDHHVETLAVSDGFCGLFGFPDRSQAVFVLDSDMYRDIHADDQERFAGAIFRFSEGEELDVVYRTRAGLRKGFRVIHARGTHLHTGTGERIAYAWYMDEGAYTEGADGDASQMNLVLSRALHEESILRATHYDPLTGLPNLNWFFRLAETAKVRILSEGKQAVLLYMDLNGMKYYNHRNGFAEGDRLLKALAETMIRVFGKENTCHITADRFAACAAEEEAENKIRRLFSAAEQINGGKSLPIRVGIYSSAMENVPVSSAYDRAKMACEAVRRSDRSDFGYYNRTLMDAVRRHQYLVENIDRAAAEKWIQVYYQPIVRAEDGKVSDVEALARWNDPVEGFLSPAEFIPQLENAGLIYKVDLCVLEQVLAKIREEQERGEESLPHSVNLSRSDFDACDIVEEIRKRVDQAGVGRDRISIELTESIIGSDFEFMKEQVARFRDLGFRVWMDDFGSGYSTLDVLQSIRFDLIKFDMSFMRKLDEGESGRIILTEMMKLAASLRLDTICEGVETEAQAAFLREIGCLKLQGYFYGRPAPLEALREPAGETRDGPETAEASGSAPGDAG